MKTLLALTFAALPFAAPMTVTASPECTTCCACSDGGDCCDGGPCLPACCDGGDCCGTSCGGK